MSRRVLERVARTRGIPAAQKMVLIVLAQHAHDDGTNAYPSQETIADLAGMTPRSVRRCLASLEAAGRIVPVAHGGNGRHTVNYSIRLDMLADNPDNMSAFTSPNPDNMSALQDDNPDNSAHKGGHFRQVRRTNTTDNPDNMSAEYGKNKDKNKEEESAEHADDAEASRVLLSFSSSHKKIESYAEAEEVATNGGKNLYAPFTDEECDFFTREHLSEEPCWHERAVLYALWLGSATDADGPSRAWGQYAGIFLESGATPREIEVGYILLRQQAESQNWEHMPGVKYLAEHWDEWRSKAKRQNAEDDAYARYWDEQDRQRQREEEARQWQREARAAEQARRDALTPEERAAEDAAQAAAEEAARAVSERLHQERMAFMRAKLAGTG